MSREDRLLTADERAAAIDYRMGLSPRDRITTLVVQDRKTTLALMAELLELAGTARPVDDWVDSWVAETKQEVADDD